MKKTITTIILATAILGVTQGQRIGSFSLAEVTALGPSASFTPTNNTTTAGDLQIVYSPTADLSNVTAVITCGSSIVDQSTVPTNFENPVKGIKLTDATDPNNPKWALYDVTCKKVQPTTLPFTLEMTANMAESWTTSTKGWAAACIQKKQTETRFGNPKSNLITHFSDIPKLLQYTINASTEAFDDGAVFDIEESANGSDWTVVVSYTKDNMPGSKALPADKVKENELKVSSRYVRFCYTLRPGKSNVTISTLTITKDTQSAIETLSSDAVQLYPIPAASILNITAPQAIKSVALYNTTGQLVLRSMAVESQLSIEGIANGYYNALITLEDGSQVSKAIIKN